AKQSDKGAQSSFRAPSRIRGIRRGSVPIRRLCLATPSAADSSAEASENPPATCVHRQKDVAGPIYRLREFPRALGPAYQGRTKASTRLGSIARLSSKIDNRGMARDFAHRALGRLPTGRNFVPG